MSDIFEWQELDSKNLIAFKNNVVFKMPKDAEMIKISCSVCNELISTMEDISAAKECDCCTTCKDIYYIPNKEKWINGWRPI